MLIDTSANNVKTSRIIKYNLTTLSYVDIFDFAFFLQELQVFITPQYEWYFFNDKSNVYIFNKIFGQ